MVLPVEAVVTAEHAPHRHPEALGRKAEPRRMRPVRIHATLNLDLD